MNCLKFHCLTLLLAVATVPAVASETRDLIGLTRT